VRSRLFTVSYSFEGYANRGGESAMQFIIGILVIILLIIIILQFV